MSKTLIMHIGFRKTGSSYLQSVLAGSMEVLKHHGIGYPEPPFQEKTAAGGLSSGNVRQFEQLLEQPDLLRDNPADRLLFSAEGFSTNFGERPFQQRFLRLISDAGIERVEILMFLRDPVSLVMSLYQQNIRRGPKWNVVLSEFFHTSNPIGSVNKVLDFFESQPKISVTIRSYSAVRATVLDEFSAWLGVARSALVVPPIKVVNRSMTASEIMLLQAMNIAVEGSGSVIGDALGNRLPDVQTDDLRPPIADQEALWDRLKDDIQRVNARVEPAHRYDRARDIMPPKPQSDMAEFSKEQINVIAETIAGLVAKIRETQPKQTEMATKMREMRERNLALVEKLRVVNEKLEMLRGGARATAEGRATPNRGSRPGE